MSSPSRPATVRDVAARAGVSIATVSRAVRGHANVDPGTRRRVEEAARQLGYRPSGVARSLRLRATRTIGLIVTDIENPYFPQIVSAVEDAARERGYSVLLADGRRDPEREIGSLEVLAERQVDGLIIASTALTSRHKARIRDVPCPVVIVNGESTVAAVPAVVSDNRSGGRLAAEHVLALGHRRLAYLAAPSADHWAVKERIAGARAAIREHAQRRASLAVIVAAEGVEGGETAARTALQAEPRTTALICYNDLAAIGAVRGLRGLGLAVPQDVSVVGFDDIEMASYVDPPLTTIRQSTGDMGRWALASLCRRIDSGREETAGQVGGRPGPMVQLPVMLVARGSTAVARGSIGVARSSIELAHAGTSGVRRAAVPSLDS
jgi:DNA-binding LacI/PurR family transcriptional regulator